MERTKITLLDIFNNNIVSFNIVDNIVNIEDNKKNKIKRIKEISK